MTRLEWGAFLKGAAHPATTYASLVTFVVGVFSPAVTDEKLWVVAAVLGAALGVRVASKYADAKVNTSTEGATP